MDKTESIVELAKAMSKMQGALTSVPKKADNPFFHSKYADLDACWDTCRKPMADNGLSLVQTTIEMEKGIYLETMLLHQSGEWIRSLLPINAMKNDPQGVGSALTYARRYAMSAMLGISADEDDDGEGAMGRQAKAKKPDTKTADVKPQATTPTAEHWCSDHNCAYRKFEKEGRTWYSHKQGDGWCNERKPEARPDNFVEAEVVQEAAAVAEKAAEPKPSEALAQKRGRMMYELNRRWPVQNVSPKQAATSHGARDRWLQEVLPGRSFETLAEADIDKCLTELAKPVAKPVAEQGKLG